MDSQNMISHGDFGGFIDLSGKAICSDCKIEKTNNHFTFYKNRVNPITKLCLYVNKKCNDCIKKYNKHKKDIINEIKNSNIIRPIPSKTNPYNCDNCKKAIVTTKTIQLDHCHKTGKFRGWLCKECNISIGNLGDDINGIIHTIKYLNKTQQISKENIISMINELL